MGWKLPLTTDPSILPGAVRLTGTDLQQSLYTYTVIEWQLPLQKHPICLLTKWSTTWSTTWSAKLSAKR